MKKNWKIWCLILLFLLILAGCCYYWYSHPKEVVRVEVREDDKKIDSLAWIIREKSLVIDSLKNEKEKVVVKVVEKTEKLKILPADSTINLFEKNLKEYGEVKIEKPELQEDSTVLCSLNNLRGANIITAKLEGKTEENKILKDIIYQDSEIISNKDSIIKKNSIMFSNMKEDYSQNLDKLNEELKKESKKKKMIGYSSILLVGIIGTLLLTR